MNNRNKNSQKGAGKRRDDAIDLATVDEDELRKIKRNKKAGADQSNQTPGKRGSNQESTNS